MRYKKLGSTDLDVSACCLGTMYFGTKVNTSNAESVMDGFLDHGGNFIDTANNYSYWVGGNGEESENLIGKWMQDRKNREDIILATKIGAMPGDRNDPSSPLEGLNFQTIIEGCEASLKRLRTDYIDLYYIHADLQQYPLEERWEAMYRLEKEGKIRYKGSSNYEFDRLLASEKIANKITGSGSTTLQQKMSFLHPIDVSPASNLKFVSEEIIQYIEEQNISLLTYSVLLSGAYERSYGELPEAYRSEENRKKFNRVLESAASENCTPSQWVLKWISEQSDQIIPLIGASSLDQLRTNMEVFLPK